MAEQSAATETAAPAAPAAPDAPEAPLAPAEVTVTPAEPIGVEAVLAAMKAAGKSLREAPAEDLAETPAAPPAVEAPKTDEPKAEDPFPKKFSLLARKEKALGERERGLKDREAKVAQWEKERAAEQEEIAQNPLGFIEKKGLTYQRITDHLLQDKAALDAHAKERELLSVKEQVALIRKSQEDREAKEKADREQHERTTAETELNAKIVATVSDEKYELIRKWGAEGMVRQVLEAEFQRSGKVLPMALAADEVEKHLEAQLEKGLTTAKAKNKTVVVKQAVSGPRATPGQSVSRTLTNSQAAAVPPRVPTEPRTRDDYMREASKFKLWEE